MKPCDSVKMVATGSEKVISILTREEVLKILAKKKNSERFELLDYKFEFIDKMNGYLGLYYTLTVSVKFSEKIEEHKFFIKAQLPSTGIHYKFSIELNAFGREARMYSEIIPAIRGVGKGGSAWAPECYFAREEVLVLEDLAVQGYAMPNKYVIFDNDHCVLVLETLARFHAGSFILEEKLRSKNKTVFEVYGDLLSEPLFKEGPAAKKSHRSTILGINALIDLVDVLEDKEKSELKRRAENWFENIADVLKPSKKYRNIICHRDLWANNFLFKYNEDTGKPEACRLIDLQFICYGIPAIDFMFSLYLTTDRETRRKYQTSFQRIYHDTLSKELGNQGLDFRDHLEWSTFVRSCEDTRDKAIAYALMNLPIMLLGAEVREKLFTQAEFQEQTLYNDRSAMYCEQFFSIEPFRERITEAILEAYELLPNYTKEN